MAEHNYIAEKMERKTYLKGTFKGKFLGSLDREKSDEKYERFFDLEITGGEILTSQQQITKWPLGNQSIEFTESSVFLVRPDTELCVTLHYLDTSVKYFRVKLQEIKLINCCLTNQVYSGNQVFGTLEGDILAYILHYDTVIKEIKEEAINKCNDESFDSGFVPPPISEKWQPRMSAFTRTSFGRSPYTPARYGFSFPGFLFGLSLLMGSIVIIKHLLLLPLFLLVGLLIIPFAYKRLMRRFNLRLSQRFVSSICIGLFLLTGMFCIRSCQSERQKGVLSTAENQNAGAMAKLPNHQNKDSFNYYFNESKVLCKRHKYDPALQYLEKAAFFASPEENKLVTDEKNAIVTKQADALVTEKKHKEAISVYTSLIKQAGSNKANLLYKRAVCYVETGNVPEAVTDLKQAIDFGDKSAIALHDKINPGIKIQVGTITRCCDGSTSNATGQGACSHHGGVCDWNEPVYEERRKYE